MMTRSRLPLLLLTVLWACGDVGTDPEDTGEGSVSTDVTVADAIAATVDDAIASMEDAMFIGLNFSGLNVESVSQLDEFSFAESNALFLDALALSISEDVAFPTSALLGAAVTGIFLLEDDPDVRALVDDWQAWFEDDTIPAPVATLVGPALTAIGDPITLPLGFSTGRVEQVAYSGMAAFELARGPALVHDPPPLFSEHQTVLRDVVRPVLIQALAYLLGITDSDFTFAVTPRMQGELPLDADTLELDYTEVLTMQAGLQTALAAVDVATAYVLTPNPLDAQGFVDAMTPGSPFLTLASGGEDALGDALERLQSAGTILLSAVDALEAETDDQTDDIIKIDPIDFAGPSRFESAEQLADEKAMVQDILDALSSPTVITENEGTVDEISFMLNAREFFINPITDLKELLPPYEVFMAVGDGETVALARWKELNIDEWTFPDPTFSGILPEMTTTSDLVDTFDELGGVFFDLSLIGGDYRFITIDGIDCDAIIAGGGSGCVFGSGFIFGANIFLGGGDGQPEVEMSWNTTLGPRDFFGSYVVVVVDPVLGTYTLTMDTVRQDTGAPVIFTGAFTDVRGFTHTDEFGRDRGGSSIVLSLFGRDWVFEKQH